MSAVRVAIATKAYGHQTVLNDVTFELVDGEIAALLGPSGCGKTTLLNLLAGIDDDFVGTITRPSAPASMVFQAPRLLPWRTLTENIAIASGVGDEDALRLLTSVGLGEAASVYPEKASLGMQRRAALARALAVKPGLVLMDEPLVSLDQENAAQMIDLIRVHLAETGASAVISTHQRDEALALADRVLELGGTPATLIRDEPSPLDRMRRRDPDAVRAATRTWFSKSDQAAE